MYNKKLSLSLAAMLVFSTGVPALASSEGTKTTNTKNSIKEDKALIKEILKPLEKKGVTLEKISLMKDIYNLPGYDAFTITLQDKRRNIKVKRYVWISKDRKHVIFDIFNVKQTPKGVSLSALRPKNSIELLKVDLSWIEDIDKTLTKHNIPHIIGKGNKRKVYIVWDIYCPFCYMHFKEIPKKAKDLNLEIHMVPFAVHGKHSIDGLLYYTKLSREKGVEKTLEYLYSLGNGDFRKYMKSLDNEIKKELPSMSKDEKEKLGKEFKDIKNKLLTKGVRGTPSIIYITDQKSQKGYVITGFKPLKEVIKMK